MGRMSVTDGVKEGRVSGGLCESACFAVAVFLFLGDFLSILGDFINFGELIFPF